MRGLGSIYSVITMTIGITKFISEHLINNPVDVYCGGPDTFRGTAIACADDVLILKDEETHALTYINAEKVVAIWGRVVHKEVDQESEVQNE